MTGKWEHNYPWVGGLIAAGAALALHKFITVSEDKKLALLQSIISAASILAGFVATALSIVASLSNNRVLDYLRSRGSHQKLYGFMLWSIYGLIAVTVISTALIFTPSGVVTDCGVAVLGFACGFSFFALLRVLSIFHLVLKD